jgi:hypothetical protein
MTWQAVLFGFVLLAFAAAGAGCGLLDAPPPLPTPPPAEGNLLANPGFEDGDQGWLAPQQAGSTPFSVSEDEAHEGSRSMRLQLTGRPSASSGSAGGVQAVDTTVFPGFVSGFYRVDSWQPDSGQQYLQFAVRVLGSDLDGNVPAHELRFVIGGNERDAPAPRDANAVFISRAAPVVGRWTYFAYPVGSALESRFGRVPLRWDGIQLSLEVRYDNSTADVPFEAADVYFDDLFMGYQFQNPNRPADP